MYGITHTLHPRRNHTAMSSGHAHAQLAVASKAQLRGRCYSLPPVSDELMHKFYPVLAHAMIEADVNSVEEDGREAMGAPLVPYTLITVSMPTMLTHRASLGAYECSQEFSQALNAGPSGLEPIPYTLPLYPIPEWA